MRKRVQLEECYLCKPEVNCYSFVFVNVCFSLRTTNLTLSAAEICEIVGFVKKDHPLQVLGVCVEITRVMFCGSDVSVECVVNGCRCIGFTV